MHAARDLNGCLDDLEAFALVAGTLAPDRLPDVVAHVETCAECQELIEGLCADTPGVERPRVSDSLVGTSIAGGAYRIVAVLASGGMGRVYRATEVALGRDVALKVPRSQARWLVRRFEREVAITARLGHPGIVPLHGAGRLDDGTPFYAMQLVDGLSLEHALLQATSREQRLGLLPHLITVANTMAFVHDRGIAHRDLKPHNVLVGKFGDTVILDWGLAKELDAATPAPPVLRAVPPPPEVVAPGAADVKPASVARVLAGQTTRPGDVLGTPAFMSPEQARGEHVDRRSDVYALGAMLEHVLVGRLPRKAAEAALAQAPAELVAVCRRAMAADRDARHADAGAFAADLRDAIVRRSSPEPAAVVHPAWWWIAAACLAAAGAGIAVVKLGWI